MYIDTTTTQYQMQSIRGFLKRYALYKSTFYLLTFT